jgi:hypothetical protein
MRHAFTLGRRARWAVPAGSALAVGAIIAGTTVAGAQTTPSLPARSAQQLLTDLQRSSGPGPMTASFTESASLGLPALPAGDSGPLSGTSLLSGSHTFNLWYADPAHVRVAEPVSLGESDLRVDGRSAWLWNSTTQTATHLLPGPSATPQAVTPQAQRLGAAAQACLEHHKSSADAKVIVLQPALGSTPRQLGCLIGGSGGGNNGGGSVVADPPTGVVGSARAHRQAYSWIGVSSGAGGSSAIVGAPTPELSARQILAAIGPSTVVSVQRNVMVAGQPAYQLSLVPKTARSLVGRVTIAVAATGYFPLRVQVFARGAASPAFSVGYTSLTLGRPAASNFAFTPPAGATVKTVRVPAPGPFGLSGWSGVAPSQSAGRQAGPRGSLYSTPADWWAARPGLNPGAVGGARTIGQGWLTVLALPAGVNQPQLGETNTDFQSSASSEAYSSTLSVSFSSSGPPAGSPDLRALWRAATPVKGSWGSGRLLRTSLVSVLLTSRGTVLIGAVTPAVLEADAAASK